MFRKLFNVFVLLAILVSTLGFSIQAVSAAPIAATKPTKICNGPVAQGGIPGYIQGRSDPKCNSAKLYALLGSGPIQVSVNSILVPTCGNTIVFFTVLTGNNKGVQFGLDRVTASGTGYLTWDKTLLMYTFEGKTPPAADNRVCPKNTP
jgi:hypothetical protein